MTKIEIGNLNILDVFNNFYVVPDYQREFVWEEKHVLQLMQDINQEFSVNDKSEYFIGSTVVNKTAGKPYEVIDGQQRLTTLFLCLCAFVKMLSEHGENVSDIRSMLYATTRNIKGEPIPAFKLELQYEDASSVIKEISNGAIPKGNFSDSSQRIIEAHSYVSEFLQKNYEKEELKHFLGYFLNNVRLVQIETPQIGDALKIFETINDRGVGLNPMDLLKNLIFRQISRDAFGKLKTEWKKIISELEKEREKPLRFLRYFIMANYSVKNPRGEEIITEDEIYDWITKDENVKQANYREKPFDFVSFILSNAEAYTRFLNAQDSRGINNIHLDNIRKLGGGAFRQHLMLLLAGKGLDQELFNHFAKQIEVLIFYYIVAREPTKEFERKFSSWSKLIKPIKTKEELNGFIQNYVQKEIEAKQSAFDTQFLALTTNSLQVYRIRYILAKLTQYVDKYYIGNYDDRDLSEYITKGVEIEHILPYTPEKELKESFGKEYDDYKIKLGNLALLEKPMNIVAGNNFFDEKKKIYKDSKFYLTRSMAGLVAVGKNSSVNRINERLKAYDKWDKQAIDDRQGILLKLAREIWKVETLK